MAKTLDDAVDGELRDVGVRIVQQRDAGVFQTDLGDGSRECTRQHRAPRDGRLRLRVHRGDQIDQVIDFQQRR